MQSTEEGFSKRAGILKRVVDWVNQGRYDDKGSWMLFGSRVLATVTDSGGEREELWERNKPEHERAFQLSGDLQIFGGKVLDARRTSLSPRPPKVVLRGLEDPEEMEPGPDWRAMEEPCPAKTAEDLDAHYSSELIGKLDKIVERATSLDPHKVDASQIHDPEIRAYFEEAHRCYLYGFNGACAVMCRAILESALKAKFDPDGSIEWELYKAKVDSRRSIDTRSPKEEKSLFRVLLEKSGLDEALKDGAERAKKGGDLAIHDYETFQKEYQSKGKVAEGLDTTRAVLANLYPQPNDPEI
jgi:hypothetical protein